MQIPYRKPGKYAYIKLDGRLTKTKLDELRQELQRLKKESRPRAISETKLTAQDGDFSENAGYQVAKARLRSINRRILELEDLLGRATIISPHRGDSVQLGNNVTLVRGDQQRSFLILGQSETDPTKGIISDQSPLGSALIGKRVNDSVSLSLRGQKSIWKIAKIS